MHYPRETGNNFTNHFYANSRISTTSVDNKALQLLTNDSFLSRLGSTLIETILITKPRISISFDGIKTDFNGCTTKPSSSSNLIVSITFVKHSLYVDP